VALFSQISVLLIFILFNFLFEVFYGQKAFFKYRTFFINMVLSFCGCFLYRVIVKQTFNIILHEKNDVKLIRVIIYGTDTNAISVAKALKFEIPSRFKIVYL
jgi:FlaA1/EpsC-like NDP-sugar epimerase